MNTDSLVRDYLGRLDAAAAALPAGRRIELTAEVGEHIDAALAAAGRSDEVTIRNVLDRLGSPEEIVAAEGGSSAAMLTGAGATAAAPGAAGPRASVAAPSGWGRVEVIALLSIGLAWPALLVPNNGILLWLGLGIIGLVLTWLSSVWSRRRKLVTTGLVVAAYVLLILLVMPVTVRCSSHDGVPLPCDAGGRSPIETGIPAGSG